MIYSKYIKRILDVFLSMVGGIILFVPMVLIAIAIKCDSKGPVFFIQTRWGMNKKEFKIIKFRTMIPNAYELGGLVMNENDKRITRVGRILRRTSLDEIPQLLNILKGEMAIIGPRPCIPNEYISFENNSNYINRFNVLPGLFCTVDVDLRSSATDEVQFQMDSDYVNNITFMGDVRVFGGVLKTVLSRKNVYKEDCIEKKS